MAKKNKNRKTLDPTAEAIKDLAIIQMALAGVPGGAIRQTLGCDMNRVTRLTRHLKPRAKGKAKD